MGGTKGFVVVLRSAVVAFSLALVSVAWAGMEGKMPAPDAGALYSYITKENPYEKWALWPGKGKLYKGREPHGALLTTYVNDKALDAAMGKSGMREGSIIVKENYTPGAKLAALTVMYKVKGYDPGAEDWFWAKYAPGGEVQAGGKVEGCIECHRIADDNGYVYTGNIGR